jgi:hypothetical protein
VTAQNEEGRRDFILARARTPEEVIGFLLERFPAFASVVPSDELDLAAPFHAYERFASYVRSRLADASFLGSVGKLIDEMAASRDPLMGDVLVTSLLEGIAEDSDAAFKISGFVGDKARDILTDIEEKVYGRYR